MPQSRLQKLIANPRVEIGVLYSAKRAGKEHKYPDKDLIIDATRRVEGNWALHVCGSWAFGELANGNLKKLLEPFFRVQVNGTYDRLLIQSICQNNPDKTIITQHTQANASLAFPRVAENHSVLVDDSGGKGISPAVWKAPITDVPVGFAGGLGPDNLKAELPRILEAAHSANVRDSWVDMEGRIRDARDCIDPDKCDAVVAVFEEFIQAH